MRPREDGFTLIEALVAMAVLAAGAVALIGAVERHATLAGAVADRIVARWAAENRLAEARLGLPEGTQARRLMGADWQTASRVSPTSDPDLLRIDVDAGPYGAARVVRLTGFVVRGDGS